MPSQNVSSLPRKIAQAYFTGAWNCRLICRLLHRIDPGHCEKSIERDEGVA